jgi:hypothetical protein
MSRATRWVTAVFVAAGVAVAGCQSDAATRSPIVIAAVDPGTVAPPYDRDKDFGRGWATVHGHCDTRETVLERDAALNAVDTDGDGCKDDGPVVDLYTGNTITPQKAQIDHVYSLKQAWTGGAWKWSPVQRRIFALDQSNLRAVTGSLNETKGDLGPAQWRPPARSGWCGYQMIYRATAARWNLPITPADDAALRDMATTCPK